MLIVFTWQLAAGMMIFDVLVDVGMWMLKVRLLRFFFFSSRRRHTRSDRDWSSDVCSSDLTERRRATATIRDVPAGGPLSGAPRTRKFEVDRAEYPFADRWLERGGSALHYVDEGAGPPVGMLHGNPTWSFLYRNVIKQLGGACRSIAPDYPGFGLSDHPPRYGYKIRRASG